MPRDDDVTGRIKLRDRVLPAYTRGEERFNMISHIAGGGLAVAALFACVIAGAWRRDALAVTGGAIYGATMVVLYAMSSLYHGLKPEMPKKVFQVIDHCSIYLLIAGTYTPVTLCALRKVSPAWGWSIFGVVWGCAVVAITLTAIDLRRYRVFSMICYLGMGWCIVAAVSPLLRAVPAPGLALLLAGGLCYTAGAVLYGVGKRVRYMHSIFHLFVVAGSLLHFFCILLYVLPRAGGEPPSA